jgi:hypothetical protein
VLRRDGIRETRGSSSLGRRYFGRCSNLRSRSNGGSAPKLNST